ncbi:hypothetical protein BCR44DRAFT_1444065 [Catenaria anguillulae PL171]|uniref:Uncharacterized protein n=1 Tax=Catenaria anguillulae PL171 TaxID=765915 RepID=A0A1Y2H9W5_9FUNG|nr:hypothetical protein BCR44DRAFT_1444065 [Catenaria anguillulae PL171]
MMRLSKRTLVPKLRDQMTNGNLKGSLMKMTMSDFFGCLSQIDTDYYKATEPDCYARAKVQVTWIHCVELEDLHGSWLKRFLVFHSICFCFGPSFPYLHLLMQT